MENYEVNLETLAIIPLNANETKIIEKNDEFIVNSSSMKIIDDCCRFFGSTYNGRIEGTKSMIGVNYKAPIILEETTPMIFFPTISPRLEACYWISFKDVDKCYKIDKKSLIVFKNGTKLEINLSYKILQNQILHQMNFQLILLQYVLC